MSDPSPDGNPRPSFWENVSSRLPFRRNVTEEDILQLVDEGEEAGVVEGSQKDMINHVLEFDDIQAQDIMTPRTDVEAVGVDAPLETVLQIGVEEGFSRIPVYEGDIDHVIGILYVKDLLPYVGKPLPETLCLRDLLREAYFVPGTKRCRDLFAEMTEKRAQLAMVVDEYGGLSGIVSMEDLVECIVGNIQDEYDDEEDEIRQTGENSFEADGSLSVDEVSDLTGITLPEGDYETLAGFLIDRLGHIPTQEEHAAVEFGGLLFTVLQMEDRRIDRVHVQKQPSEAE